MTRRRFTDLQRADLFMKADGICHICGVKVQIGQPWDIEHVIPLAMGGEDGGDNLKPAHRSCHAAKTATDKRDLAKVARIRAKHIGAKKRSTFQTSRDGPFKAKIGGGIERRALTQEQK